MRSFMALAFLTAAACLAASVPALAGHEMRDTASDGPAATYRVTVEPGHEGMGIAVSTDGWVITAADLVEQCPSPPAPCTIRIDDADRGVRRSAEIVATDQTAGLALLRANGSLPAAAALSPPAVRRAGPIYAYATDDDQRITSATVGATRAVKLFGDPPASGTMTASTLECRKGTYGTAIFALDDGRMLGIVIGTAGPDGGTTVIPANVVRAFYERGRAQYLGRHRDTSASAR